MLICIYSIFYKVHEDPASISIPMLKHSKTVGDIISTVSFCFCMHGKNTIERENKQMQEYCTYLMIFFCNVLFKRRKNIYTLPQHLQPVGCTDSKILTRAENKHC